MNKIIFLWPILLLMLPFSGSHGTNHLYGGMRSLMSDSAAGADASATSANAMVDPSQCGGSNAPSWCAGTTADAWIRAACTQLSERGGIVDLRGFGGRTETIAAQVTCSTPKKQVQFLVNPATHWNITESDGKTVFPLDNASGIDGGYGQVVGGSNGGGFFLAPTANVRAIFGPAHEDYSQEAMYVIGVTVSGATGARVGKGLIYVFGLGTPTAINYNEAKQCNTACYWIENTSGLSNFIGNEGNVTSGNNDIRGSACVFFASNGRSPRNLDWNIEGDTCQHANGRGNSDLLITSDGSGALNAWLHVRASYFEAAYGNGAEVPDNQIFIKDCIACSFSDLRGNTSRNFITIAQTAKGYTREVTFQNVFDGAAGATLINDMVNQRVIPESTARYVGNYAVAPD